MKQINMNAFIFSLGFFVLVGSAYADRYQRPMEIHKINKIGLEIWTELEPKWVTDLMMNDRTPIFVAHSPENTYPPSGMLWVNHAELNLADKEFNDVAKSTLITAAKNFAITKSDLKSLKIIPTNYGKLIGYEVNFLGVMDKKSVDVKVFTGRANGKGPITMQAYTLKGKMKDLSEQVRRSWTHTTYLE